MDQRRAGSIPGDGAASGRPRCSEAGVEQQPKRKSDPVRPRRKSGAAPRQQDSWEFPLSREEKKYRVISLYEQELAEANHAGEELEELIDENEALHAQLEQLEERHAQASKVAPGGARETVVQSKQDVAAAAGRPGVLGRCLAAASLLLALLIGAAILLVPDVAENRSKTVPETQVGELSEHPGPAEGAAEISRQPSTGPPNPPVSTTATASRLEAHGLERLKGSDCFKAAWYFSSALGLVKEQMDELGGAVTEELVSQRMNLLGNRGFALVCAQRFQEGLELLEEQREVRALRPEAGVPAYLLNAQGFALFKLQGYAQAVEAFSAGVAAEPDNPILWSNLGAAQMVLGDLQAADDALFQAAELLDPKKRESEAPAVDAHHQAMFGFNVEILRQKASGAEVDTLPAVELWWGGAAVVVPSVSAEL